MRKTNNHNLFVFLSTPFLVLLSCTAVFSFNDYLRLYVVASIFYVLAALIIVMKSFCIPRLQNFEVLFFVFICYAALVSFFLPNPKSLNYLSAYLYVFVIIISTRIIFRYINHRIFLKYIFGGVLITVSFIFVDSISFFLGFDLQEYLMRDPTADSKPESLGGDVVRRAYGFSTEPIYLSAYLVTMGVLSLWYVKQRYSASKNLFFLMMLLISIILTFSASALGALIISSSFFGMLWVLIRFEKIRLRLDKTRFFLLVLLVISCSILLNFFHDYILSMIQKMLFIDEHFGSARGDLWVNIIKEIKENYFLPHGNGASSLDNVKAINWYLLVAYDLGLFGLFLVIILVFVSVWSIFHAQGPLTLRFIFAAISFASFIQLATFSAFYYPYAFIFSVLAREILSVINKKIDDAA